MVIHQKELIPVTKSILSLKYLKLLLDQLLKLRKVDDLYKEIIAAGTHLASSIEIAEASKVIENTQRDVNIALINDWR